MIKEEFGVAPDSLCNHPAGTHMALRGANAEGTYLTSSLHTENYSGGTNLALARAIAKYLDEQPESEAIVDSTVTIAAVAGVVRGKHLPRHAVTHQFIHYTFNHDEARVLKHLHHALCDVDPWWSQVI